MEYKSHTIRVSNIPVEKKLYRTTDKSLILVACCWCVTAFLAIVLRSYFALLTFFYSLFVTFSGDNVIFEGYRHFFVIYDQYNRKYCDIIYLSDVARWSYQGDYFSAKIFITMRDGEKITISKGVDHMMKRYFLKVMKKKQDRIRTVRRMKDVL